MRKNYNGVYKTLGATNHSKSVRDNNDFYTTPSIATNLLLDVELFNKNIWECACGVGHISKILEQNNYNVKSTDKIDRGYGDVYDFLQKDDIKWNGDIITNPPYKYAIDFVYKSLGIIPQGNKVAMLLRVLFLESKSRKKLFNSFPFKTLYVFSSRISCLKNNVDRNSVSSGAMAYGWFVWEKGFNGTPEIKWIN